jgi:hypothetical protein
MKKWTVYPMVPVFLYFVLDDIPRQDENVGRYIYLFSFPPRTRSGRARLLSPISKRKLSENEGGKRRN